MDPQLHQPRRLRPCPYQLPLPLEPSLRPEAPPGPCLLPVVAPQQVWASLSVPAQTQLQRTVLHIFQEVLGDARSDRR
jgi:hypothetical protein